MKVPSGLMPEVIPKESVGIACRLMRICLKNEVKRTG